MSEEIINKAQQLMSSDNLDEAINLLKPLAEQGNIIAKSNLGMAYSFYNENGDFSRLDEAGKILNEACEAGEPSACHNLGTLWLGNIPALGKDLQKAAYYYLKARDLGGPVATEEFYAAWEKELNG